ncbi:MAG: biopolymer transporter ExbD [Mucilaginibacter polytrichastri]|nr:biopolymer transporter ExbD [Mucilaginibacter polytrichastri]
MAELNTSAQSNSGKPRSKKLTTRIDLTAMVDLAFLLITFFMLTTSLSKPQAMDLAMPDNTGPERLPVPETRTLTLCLGKDNGLVWYRGSAAHPIGTPAKTGYGKDGLRRILLGENSKTQRESGKPVIVLVKAADRSKYENFVATLDELKITGIQTYAVVDITSADDALLKAKGL